MKYDFTKIELIGIDDKVIAKAEFHKTMGNALHAYASDVEFVEIAKAIWRGEEVELTDKQLEEVRKVINGPNIALYARKAFNDFINKSNKEDSGK